MRCASGSSLLKLFWFLLAGWLLLAQAPKVFSQDIGEWVVQDGVSEEIEIIATRVLDNNRLVIFGWFRHKIVLGAGTSSEIELIGSNEYEKLFIANYNEDGTLERAALAHINSLHTPYYPGCIDQDGSVYMGASITAMTFGDAPNDTTLASHTGQGMAIVKFNNDGQYAWCHFIDGPSGPAWPTICEVGAVACDDNHVYLTGVLSHEDGTNAHDLYLAKLTSSGTLVWECTEEAVPSACCREICIGKNTIDLSTGHILHQVSLEGQYLETVDLNDRGERSRTLLGDGEILCLYIDESEVPSPIRIVKEHIHDGLVWELRTISPTCTPRFDHIKAGAYGKIHIMGWFDGVFGFSGVDGYGLGFEYFDGPKAFNLVLSEMGNLVNFEAMGTLPQNYWALSSHVGLSYAACAKPLFGDSDFPSDTGSNRLWIKRLNRGDAPVVSGRVLVAGTDRTLPKRPLNFDGKIQFRSDSSGCYRVPLPKGSTGSIHYWPAYFETADSVEIADIQCDRPDQDIIVNMPIMDSVQECFARRIKSGESGSDIFTVVNHGRAMMEATAQFVDHNMYFDGVNDCLRYADRNDELDALSTAITVEAWIKPMSIGTHARIVDRSDDQNIDRFILSVDGAAQTAGWNINKNVLHAGFIPLNQYSHVAGTYDGHTMRLYVNGELVAAQVVNTIIDVTESDIYIGDNDVNNRPFHGHIDDVALWRTARTQTEIQQDMLSLLPEENQDLLAWWRFDRYGYGGQEFYDRSLYRRVLAIANVPSQRQPQLKYEDVAWFRPLVWSGVVQPESSVEIQLALNTQDLDPGFYRFDIMLDGTDLLRSQKRIPFTVEIYDPTCLVRGDLRYHDGTPLVGHVVYYGDGSDSVFTDSEGYYRITVPEGWSGFVRPKADSLRFYPEQYDWSNVTEDKIMKDFKVEGPAFYLISGRVVDHMGNGVPNTRVGGSGLFSAWAVTNAEGNYSFRLPYNSHLQFRPSVPYNLNQPLTRDIYRIDQNWSGQDFTVFQSGCRRGAILAHGYPEALVNLIYSKNINAVVSQVPNQSMRYLDVTVFTDSSSAWEQRDNIVKTLEAGKSLIFMSVSPYVMAGMDSALTALSPWFPAGVFDIHDHGTAVMVNGHPWGLNLEAGSELMTASDGPVYGISVLNPQAQVLSAWSDYPASYHAVIFEAGGGRVAWFAHFDENSEACKTLFSGVLDWALGGENPVTAVEESRLLPETMLLYPAYPNPFNPSTSLEYAIPAAGDVRLEIYDISGRRVKVLESGYQHAGRHECSWQSDDENGCRVASGLYIARLQVGNEVKTQKLMLMK